MIRGLERVKRIKKCNIKAGAAAIVIIIILLLFSFKYCLCPSERKTNIFIFYGQ